MKAADARAELNRGQFLNIGPNHHGEHSNKSKNGKVVAMDPTPGNAYPPTSRSR